MGQKWDYATLTINKNGSGGWFVESVKPNAFVGVQGTDAIEAMKDLGTNGWELVTSFTLPGDVRPNLVFKRTIEG